MPWIAYGLFSLQVALILCFVFFAFFNYVYGFASLRKPRIRRVRHSGVKVAAVIVSHNERFVLPETLAACDLLTFPNRILVLADDSDDAEIVEDLRKMAMFRGCRQVDRSQESLTEEGVCPNAAPVEVWESADFVFLHRQSNDGFKGGNLRMVSRYLRNRGIKLLYLLDADWRPQADCIERALEVLEADDRIAFVQTKRLTLMQDLGLFQRYVLLSEEGNYYVDFEGRQVMRHPILFSGCCALLRLDAIDSVGGFAYGHLTEDLDVSNRLWVAGWKGVYCGKVVNYGEVPFSYDHFRGQQERWACGAGRCLRDYFLPILQSKHLTWFDKLSAIRQDAHFGASLLTAISIVQGLVTILWLTLQSGTYQTEYYLSLVERWQLPVFLVVYMCVLSNLLGPVLMILAKKRRPLELVYVPMGQWYSYSVLFTYVRGTVKGWLGSRDEWYVTPKLIRGQSGMRSSRKVGMRLINAGACSAPVSYTHLTLPTNREV